MVQLGKWICWAFFGRQTTILIATLPNRTRGKKKKLNLRQRLRSRTCYETESLFSVSGKLYREILEWFDQSSGLRLTHTGRLMSHNNSESHSVMSAPTPAGVPQIAAWAPSLSQAPLGHQASWQPFSWSSSDSFLLLLLHGMAVVPLTELWTALDTNTLTYFCLHLWTSAVDNTEGPFSKKDNLGS